MRLILFLFSALLSSLARADVVLAGLFQDQVVLQRGRPVPVWGRAEPGERISVKFEQQTATTTASADGRWIVYLEPLEARTEPTGLVVSGRNTITVADVVVGDVWLCSGQSNMAFTVGQANRAREEMASARFPLIREFKVAQVVAAEPQETLGGEWKTATPESVGGFTAVGYFFARDLHRKLGVPIGLINSSRGATPVEAWMSPAALMSDPAFGAVETRWQAMLGEYPAKKEAYDLALASWTAEADAAKAANRPFNKGKPTPPVGPGDAHTPAGLFNGMINPLLPFAIRGAIWYQGEGNAARAAEYHPLFAALITHWRAHFGQGDFPFYWVQLANFKTADPNSGTWPLLREAQSRTLSLPETGQVVSIDIGDPDEIHPRNKQEVARRLALIARAKVYGIAGDFSGPIFAGAAREKAALRVYFEHAVTGLTARAKPLQSFEVAGEDRVFRPAVAAIDGDTLLVSAPDVRVPVAVRYAWRNSPEANLFNGAGLPAAPFRSDDW